MHAECFKCLYCKNVINGRYFSEGRDYVCEHCHVQNLQVKENHKEHTARRKEHEIKRKNTDKFTLYWRSELKPQNQQVLSTLGVKDPGLLRTPYVSVCFDSRTRAVYCAPTERSDTSLNVSYLACALKVL